MQCGEPDVNLHSPQDISFGTPARKTKKRVISSSTISSPDASCSAWFSVDCNNEPECVNKDENNSTKLLINERVTNEPEIHKENFSMGLIPPSAPIKNLPGKNKNKKKFPPKVINKSNKCAKCKVQVLSASVIYDSKVDLSLSKIYGLQNHWIGCDVVNPCACDYWAHAGCVDITVKKRKTKGKKYEIITPPFTCPKHSGSYIYFMHYIYTIYVYILSFQLFLDILINFFFL